MVSDKKTKTQPECDTHSESEISNIEESQNNPQQAMDFIEKLEWLIHVFFQAVRNPSYTMQLIAFYVMTELDGYNKFDKMVKWLARNPISSFALFILSLLSLPFFMVIGIFASVAAITLTSFIAFEGTILTFALVILFGCLGALGFVLILTFAIAYAIYTRFTNIYDMHGNGNVTASQQSHTNNKNQHKTNVTNRAKSPIDSIGPISQ